MYIRSTGNISPQPTFGHPSFPFTPVGYAGPRLRCAEPDYKEIIDVKLIRRMSRIIKMGVASAMECLLEAGITKPGAIVTGTAYGCLEDTGHFITKMVEHNEELLTPTSFIQSTHNTIGAQIGLMLQCNNYNNAFVHRGFSFESALLDAMMLLQEKATANVLAGAVDEITDISHAILNRFDLYKKESTSNLDLFSSGTRGTIAGEGAAFFVLANEPASTDYAKLDGLHTFYKPANDAETEGQIKTFLSEKTVSINDIDLVITGRNGNKENDRIFDVLDQSVFNQLPQCNFKHLCGEYPTATAFALWMAVNIIKTGKWPLDTINAVAKEPKKILICNNYLGIHHTLLLVSAC